MEQVYFLPETSRKRYTTESFEFQSGGWKECANIKQIIFKINSIVPKNTSMETSAEHFNPILSKTYESENRQNGKCNWKFLYVQLIHIPR